MVPCCFCALAYCNPSVAQSNACTQAALEELMAFWCGLHWVCTGLHMQCLYAAGSAECMYTVGSAIGATWHSWACFTLHKLFLHAYSPMRYSCCLTIAHSFHLCLLSYSCCAASLGFESQLHCLCDAAQRLQTAGMCWKCLTLKATCICQNE